MYPTKPIRTINDQRTPGPVNVVRFSKTGDYCMSAGHDATVRLWKPMTGQQIKSYSAHSRDILCLDIAADNSTFVSSGHDKSVFFWDVLSGRILRKFHGHTQRVNDVALNTEANLVASASVDCTIRLWDCRDHDAKKPVQIMNDAKDSISSLSIVGSEIITGSIDGSVRIYDVRAGKLTVDSLNIPITSVKQTNDGNCLLVSTLDNNVLLLDKATGDVLSQYTGHKNSKYKIESILSNSDTHVISGSEDGIIYIWDLVEEEVVARLFQHSRSVLSLSYHPTQDYLMSGSSDGSIILWGPDNS